MKSQAKITPRTHSCRYHACGFLGMVPTHCNVNVTFDFFYIILKPNEEAYDFDFGCIDMAKVLFKHMWTRDLAVRDGETRTRLVGWVTLDVCGVYIYIDALFWGSNDQIMHGTSTYAHKMSNRQLFKLSLEWTSGRQSTIEICIIRKNTADKVPLPPSKKML